MRDTLSCVRAVQMERYVGSVVVVARGNRMGTGKLVISGSVVGVIVGSGSVVKEA